MKRRVLAAACILCVAATMWIVARPRPWVSQLPAATPYRIPGEGSQPVLRQTTQLASIPDLGASKPVVAADANGDVLVLAHMEPLGDSLIVWRSSERGETWSQPTKLANPHVRVGGTFDPWLDTDGRGHYYTVHSQGPFVLRSRDAGTTWSEPVQVSSIGGDRPVLRVSPNGKHLVVAAATAERAENAPKILNGNDPDLESKIRASIIFSTGVFLSNDFGTSWERLRDPFAFNEHAIAFSVVVDDRERVAASWIIEGGGSRSAVSVSLDRGQTWEITPLAEPLQPDRVHPFNGERFPVLDIDESNTLHVAYVESGASGLAVRRSRDWQSWEPPMRLSNSAADEVRLAAIDACGPMVHVMWCERNGEFWNAFYRGSMDHGATWSAPICLSKMLNVGTDSAATGFRIHSDDDQSSLYDDRLGRVHAVWTVQGGKVMHAMIDWASVPGTAEELRTVEPSQEAIHVAK